MDAITLDANAMLAGTQSAGTLSAKVPQEGAGPAFAHLFAQRQAENQTAAPSATQASDKDQPAQRTSDTIHAASSWHALPQSNTLQQTPNIAKDLDATAKEAQQPGVSSQLETNQLAKEGQPVLSQDTDGQMAAVDAGTPQKSAARAALQMPATKMVGQTSQTSTANGNKEITSGTSAKTQDMSPAHDSVSASSARATLDLQASKAQATVPQTTVAQYTVPQTIVPQTTVAQNTVPQTTVAQNTVPQTIVPQTIVPETTVSQATVPQPTVAQNTVVQATVPQPTMPQTAAVQNIVAQNIVAQTTAEQAAARQATAPQITAAPSNPDASTQLAPAKPSDLEQQTISTADPAENDAKSAAVAAGDAKHAKMAAVATEPTEPTERRSKTKAASETDQNTTPVQTNSAATTATVAVIAVPVQNTSSSNDSGAAVSSAGQDALPSIGAASAKTGNAASSADTIRRAARSTDNGDASADAKTIVAGPAAKNVVSSTPDTSAAASVAPTKDGVPTAGAVSQGTDGGAQTTFASATATAVANHSAASPVATPGHTGTATHTQAADTSSPYAASSEPQVLARDANVLEVGLPTSTHGWLRVRAEMTDSGSIAATVSASTDAAHTALREQSGDIEHFLRSESVPLASLTVASTSGTAMNTSTPNHGSQSDAQQRSFDAQTGSSDQSQRDAQSGHNQSSPTAGTDTSSSRGGSAYAPAMAVDYAGPTTFSTNNILTGTQIQMGNWRGISILA
jgi:hypothetical protein